ncbi:MAG TPA: HAD-IIB family hydrolase [Fibrobacteraceae bacterium]|nr:HAD-IIB family hydrolase [Fibrobacteraceae bacterium]
MKPNPLTSKAPPRDNRLFLFCDLDGTLTPYGEPEGTPGAYPMFRRLAQHPEIVLAYVTGRTLPSAKEVITRHGLPLPHYLVGDVGATMEQQENGQFVPMPAWSEVIARDWPSVTGADIITFLQKLPEIRPQEPDFQNRHKACFYTAYDADGSMLVNRVRTELLPLRIRSQVEWSRDDLRQVGYLDILPLGAGKLGAVRWLLSQAGISEEQALFAGDSGNDLPVFTSGLRCVMPRNGQESVRREAFAALEKRERGLSRRFYQSQGGFLGCDGYVLGGTLEGIAAHFPQTREWMSIPKPLKGTSKN